MKMQNLSNVKVAWLIPSMARGFAFRTLLQEFAGIFPNSVVFTGVWPKNYPAEDVSFNLKIVGRTRFLTFGSRWSNLVPHISFDGTDYRKTIIIPPLGIPFHLLKFSPDVVLAYGFSIWTVIALLLKPFRRWRVIIFYEGSTPRVDVKDSKFRVFWRKLMTRLSNAFITNSHSGKDYLVQFLKAKKELVFVRPYLVPDKSSLSRQRVEVKKLLTDVRRPVFLYVGLIIQRKGLKFLIESFAALKKKGYENYTLAIVGEGPQQEELESLTKQHGIEKQVKWVGWVDYHSLGYIFDSSDIFVFPTFEDTWGMVVLEAMTFAKPILCSELAGAMEMVKNGENGFIFNPATDTPEEFSEIIKRFIDDPHLIPSMGQKSKEKASCHNPQAVVSYMKYIIEFVLGWRDRGSKSFSEYPQEQH